MSASPEILRGVRVMQAWSRAGRAAGKRIALVPTMGNLHEGHLSLIRLAQAECPLTIVSSFVNPTQFGPGEDYASYPRTWDADLAKLSALGVDAVFAPTVEEIYPPGDRTRVVLGWGTDKLCGAFRPGHFDGVSTVVAKLFGATQPDRAYFGQKDAQQALILRRMTEMLCYPLELRLGPTLREADGLALSSRNIYLSPEERRRASALFAALESAGSALLSGERDAGKLEALGATALSELELEYFSVVDPKILERPERLRDGLVLMACAARVGPARLIDNHVYRIEGERAEEAALF